MTEQPMELWEQWVTSTVHPIQGFKRGAKVFTRDGQRWITYPDILRGKNVTIEMPANAPTRKCDQGRHEHCPHRLGQPAEGGVQIVARYYQVFVWRCGCTCHRDPQRIGWLF
ncbi:hypothetical protein BTO20_37570 (plasmid) [Mycobacterium dioxanotrophicus]|jgi:hypothetical protein|uniref:Uncharacterized protein n=1 Tax=Mycobacterium dioxanotrophicus TaxID=482462 RepID=A0A1Y0CHB5_9MYCO|nr:hypothetical protein [Mycobacterium dioxanotrophicus]ART74335.1 hypothetical protein BTO20_37570 [Mycobacterium dioxanotrophicus]